MKKLYSVLALLLCSNILFSQTVNKTGSNHTNIALTKLNVGSTFKIAPNLTNRNTSVPSHRTCGSIPPNEAWENEFQSKIQEYLNSPESSVRGGTYRIPVIVHVIHDNTSSSNISAAQINSQITTLNNDYGGTNADVSGIPAVFQSVKAGNTSIEFCLALKDPNGNTLSEPGINRVLNTSITGLTWTAGGISQSDIDAKVKPNTIWDVNKYLNLWVIPISGGILGYATFPSGSTLTGLSGGGTSTTDGVVIGSSYFGTLGNVTAPYDKGRTATHEIGHWLGLRHISGDAACGNDYCNDTPPQAGGLNGGQGGLNYGCTTHPFQANSCSGNPNGEMFMDYMDYVDDACMIMFSADQKTRMQTCMSNGTYRKNLTTSANTICAALTSPPVADFVGTPLTIPAGGTATFTDLSTNGPSSWLWSVSPATGVSFSSTTSQSPSITFANVGSYSVTLKSTNTNGNDTKTKTNYINVVSAGTICGTLNNISNADTIDAYTFGTWGYLPGPNSYSIQAYAEKFTNTSTGTISKINIIPLLSDQRSTSGVVTFKIYDGTSGLPGTALTNGTQSVPFSSLTTGVDNTITFNPPVTVNGNFFVSCEFTYGTPQDTIVLGLAHNASNTGRINTAYTNYNNTWYDNVTFLGINTSLTIKTDFCPIASAPVTDFSASPTTLNTGGIVSFTDLSTQSPTTWTWSASPSTGVTFSSTSAQHPTATFANSGTYSITLTSGNTNGTNTLTKTAYITVNAPTITCTTFDNIQASDTVFTSKFGTWGYLPGPNSYSIPAYAEKFNNTQIGQVSNIQVWPIKLDARSSGGLVTFKIYTVNAQGKPGTVMTNGTKTVLYTNLTQGVYNPITFSPAVNVTGAFFVSTEFTYGSPQDTIVLGMALDRSNSSRVNTAYTKYNGVWYDNIALLSYNSSYSIAAEVCPPPAPTCNFSATPLNLYTGQSTTFTDLSTGSPTTWTWSVSPNTGVTFSNVNAKNPTASFTTAGAYTITLTASNSGGSNSLSKSAYINVTAPVITCDSLSNSNFQTGDNFQAYTLSQGYYPGNNIYNLAYAEFFNNPNSVGTLSNFWVDNYYSKQVTSNGVITFKVYDVVNGLPGTQLTNGSLTVPYNALNDGFPTLLTFDQPVSVIGDYFISMELSNYAPNKDSILLAVLSNPANTSRVNTSFIKYDGIWSPAPTVLPSVGKTSYAIYSEICTSSGLTVNISSSSNNVCSGGSTTLSAITSGGTSYTYNWIKGGVSVGTTQSITVTPTSTSTYTCSVLSAGFVVSSTVTVIVHSLPNLTLTASASSICFGLNVTLTGAGASTYNWSTGMTTSSITVSPTTSRTYTLIGSTAGCSTTLTKTITVDKQVIALNITPATCGNINGTAVATVTGGVQPYTYNWSNGDNTNTADTLSTGVITLTVIDNAGCKATKVASIGGQGGPSITVSNLTNVSCFGGNNGSATIAITGAAPFTTNWSNGSQTSTANNLFAGQYEVAVTDNNGCTSIESVTISEPTDININLSITKPNCSTPNGNVTAAVTGGTPTYTYSWSNGGTNSSINSISSGNYNVQITDIKGCNKSATVSVPNIIAPTAIIDSIRPAACNQNNGAVFVSITNGTGNLTYSWSNNTSNQDASNLAAGTYSLTVTDGVGCKASTSAVVPLVTVLPPEICIISANVGTTQNVIVWEKPTTHNNISHYNIFREGSQTGVYNYIGQTSTDSLSEYVDVLSNFLARAYRYKISAVDTCGIETEKSTHHKSFYLAIYPGFSANVVNLYWDNYEGFVYPTFYINRYSNTNGWETIDSLPSTEHFYTDLNAPVSGDLSYYVSMQRPSECNSSRGRTYNTGRSNTQNLRGIAPNAIKSIASKPASKTLIYPNPSNGMYTIETIEESNCKVYNTLGKLILETNLLKGKTELNLKEKADGVYFIEVKNASNQLQFLKIIKQ